MTDRCCLSIDIGTHSSRVAIINTQAEILWLKKFSYTLHYINEDYIEQDAHMIVEGLKELIQEAVNLDFDIVCCALASQRSTVVAWDKQSGVPLHPALSWMDTRAKAEVMGLAAHQKTIKEKTGLVLSPHYGASKIRWLQRQLAAQGVTEYGIGPLMSYVLFHLVRGRPYVCDESNASRTQLFNIYSRNWSKFLSDTFHVEPEYLPSTLPSRADFGELDVEGDKRIPVLTACGDQNAAFYAMKGLSVFERGQAAVANFGTGAFVVVESTDNYPPPQLLHTHLYGDFDKVDYAIEATVNGAGSAVEWLCDKWLWAQNKSEPGVVERSDFFVALGDWFGEYSPNDAQLPIFINTLGGLAAPYWRVDIPHNFVSTREDLTWADQAMAIFESIGFLIRRNLEELELHNPVTVLAISGGLINNIEFRQMLANITSKKMVVNGDLESTLLGAAGLAFSTYGLEMQIDAAETNLVYTPSHHELLEERYQTFKHYLDNYQYGQ